MNDEAKCLFPPCKKDAKVLGLCLTHYRAAWQAVAERKTSWRALVGLGRIHPPVCVLRAFFEERRQEFLAWARGEEKGAEKGIARESLPDVPKGGNGQEADLALTRSKGTLISKVRRGNKVQAMVSWG